jgi:hypothetical protein
MILLDFVDFRSPGLVLAAISSIFMDFHNFHRFSVAGFITFIGFQWLAGWLADWLAGWLAGCFHRFSWILNIFISFQRSSWMSGIRVP